MSKVKSLFGSYLSHLAGYVMAAAGIVGTIDPKVFPPQYQFVTALAGLVTVVGSHAYSAGSLNGAATAAANAAASALKTAGAATAAVLLCGLLILPGLSGCSTAQLAKANAVVTKVNTAVTSPAAQPIIQAAALVAVGTAEQHGVSAAQLVSLGNAVLAADSGTTATLSALAGVANAQLAKLNLPPADLAAAPIVEAAINTAISAQVGNNATLAQSQAALADLLRALVTAAGGTPVS